MRRLKALKRGRVDHALQSIFEYPLTIVEAPMGYGKTTAVSGFLESRGNPVIWLSFMSSEDTVSFIWDRLTDEISRINEEAGAKLKRLGFPVDASQTANVLSVFSKMEFQDRTTLVIDDFHLVKNPQIGSFLYLLIKDQPDNLYVTIITRDTSNLDLLELVAKGLCNILPQQILRFTADEVRDYCTMMGHNLNNTELNQLYSYTGGWISMVYLTLLGIRQGIPIGKNDIISDLVEKALYNTYDDDIRRFLLRLSIMDSFTDTQAAFVTKEPKARDILKKLRLENAFITYDRAEGIYRIHSVLLDFLRSMQKDEDERKDLYRRLGEWHLKKGECVHACSHFCRAGDMLRILSLLNDKDNIAYNSTSFEGALKLPEVLPQETLFEYPFAYLLFISKMLTGNPEFTHEGLIRLNEFENSFRHSMKTDPAIKKRILGEISTLRIFTAFNDPEQMVAQMNEAIRLLEGKPSLLMKKESEFTFGSPHLLYTYYKKPGNLKKTADYMIHEFPAFSAIANGCGTGCDYLTMAEYSLETGLWQSAEINAVKAIHKARTRDQTGIIICASFVLIRLSIFLGRTEDALEMYKQLKKDVLHENDIFYNTALEIMEGYIYACIGRIDGIPPWLQSGDMSPAHFMFEGIAFNYIVHGKALLLSKDHLRLEVSIEEFRQHFSVFNNQLGFLHNKIFEAIAKYHLYDIDRGLPLLKEALEMARDDHLVLTFAEYSPDIIAMMRTIYHSDSRDPYIKEVLAACEQYLRSVKNTPQSSISLSPREIQVLLLARDGLKRDEIARRLQISTATVRTHLQNIYHKLEVGGRSAAVKKAAALKLI